MPLPPREPPRPAQDAISDEQIQTVIAGGFRWLRFPRELEALFEDRQRAARDRHVALVSLLAVIVQNCFLLTDSILVPDLFPQAMSLRLGWVTGVMLAALVPLLLRPPVWLRESVIAGCAFLIAAVVVWLSARSHAPTAAYHSAGLVLIPMFSTSGFRLRVWYALPLCAAILALPLLFLHATGPLEQAVLGNNDLVLTVGIVFSLFACYRLEHQDRRGFLLGERDRRQRAELTEANAHLHDLTTLDPLTGIYNRRQFEAMLKLLWAQAVETARPLALLMIDVDAFKSYNDRYGHPEGDICLKRVAVSLAAGIRREGTLVARIGGDEFAVLALGLDEPAALALGQALHDGVAALAIPHRFSAVTGTVSLSIGCASLRPQTWERPEELVDLADAAVYAAKAAGRNCVAGSGGSAQGAAPRGGGGSHGPSAVSKSPFSVVGGRDLML